MAKATIKEIEVERIIKEKTITGITLELSQKEARLIKLVIGQTYFNVGSVEGNSIYNALESIYPFNCPTIEQCAKVQFSDKINNYLNGV